LNRPFQQILKAAGFLLNPDMRSVRNRSFTDPRTALRTLPSGFPDLVEQVFGGIAIGPRKHERAWRWIESHDAHRWMRNKIRVMIDP
jgi:hypothetical protein